MQSLRSVCALAMFVACGGTGRNVSETTVPPSCRSEVTAPKARGAVLRERSVALPAADEPVIADINHLLFYGQSLSAGAIGQKLLPSFIRRRVVSRCQPYANLTFAGGPKSTLAG